MGQTLFVSGILLLLFYIIDRLAWNREPAEVKGKKVRPAKCASRVCIRPVSRGCGGGGAGERRMGQRRNNTGRPW